MKELKIGQKVPHFRKKNQAGKWISPKDLKGKKVVLFFYPKDDTPGCTKEACGFRDIFDQIIGLGVEIIGVSPDSALSHQKFIDKFKLPFDLLVDEEHAMADLFGVWGEKSLYGRKFMGVKRSTFIWDEKGVISHIFLNVRPAQHPNQVLLSLEENKGERA